MHFAVSQLKSEIAKVNDQAMMYYKNKDAEAIGDLYTEDCKIMVPGSEIKHGRAGEYNIINTLRNFRQWHPITVNYHYFMWTILWLL